MQPLPNNRHTKMRMKHVLNNAVESRNNTKNNCNKHMKSDPKIRQQIQMKVDSIYQ